MRDWRKLVAEKLERADLTTSQKDEVAAELAGHLEDLCEARRAEGLTEKRAIDCAMGDVPDWSELSRKIVRAKSKENEMNHRTKAVWIPGLISLTAASAVLALMQVWGLRPHIVWARSGLALLFYVPWLAAQPAFGAIGAYISRRNGGDWRERLTAGVLPSAAMVATFCVVACIEIAVNAITNGHEITLIGLSSYIVAWSVVPGFGLTLGALPFLRNVRPQEVH